MAVVLLGVIASLIISTENNPAMLVEHDGTDAPRKQSF
jgi:hypothetical protein